MASGHGVGLYRFDGLGQDAENLADGSALVGQAWMRVSVAPAGGGPVQPPALVAVAGPLPEQRTVHVGSQSEWAGSEVSSLYRRSVGGAPR